MWPGQQPPGGEQNPQDQNPYQQPGYQQQPNPYQQPGYPPQPGQQPGYAQPGQPGQPGHAGYPGQPGHPGGPGYEQPNPYQQPTVPQYAVPGQPPGPPMPPRKDDDKKKTTIVAIVAATAVVVAAGVTGFLVLKDDDKKATTGGDPKPSQSASQPTGAPPSPVDNPRDGSDTAKPTIPGWKVVYNPKHGTQFDVPAEWEVLGAGTGVGFEDEKKGDGSPLVTMSAPAEFMSKWCTSDSNKDGRQEDSGLAMVGTKGGQGAKNTAEAAYNEAGTWVWAGYAQTEPKGTVKITKAVPYTTKSGLTGHVATATALNTKKEGKCDTDGKSIAFSFKNDKGDFASWVLYANTGVTDELPDATIQQILGTVRLAGAGS
ncbi:hypothetical protein QWM81_21290 [Streptomyces ficellus]|uniref:DUF8017 domain-containing protein n=1 Tax=Streptomyces ficellus TaxID=1977088 RepID=A0ABT7ZAK3_9ACTN|nr:hypothetical protein [Streptomyces ficellus]MDN3296537.1 hypothetical protein [Streptomyces ficellus]